MKTAKSLIGAVLIAGALLATTTGFAGNKIRIATEGAWAPFNFIDNSGKAQGFDVDIARALCSKMEKECDIVTQDWDGLIPSLKVKKFDAIIASMSITDERKKQVDFTDHYYSGGLRYMGAAGTNLDSLKGKVIGAQRSTVASQYLEDKLSGVATIKLYDTQDNVYLDLKSGRLDGALSDELPTYNWLATDAGKGFEFKGDAFAKDDKIGIAVRKGDKLRAQFNKALAEILKDGTYQKINAKYFPFSIY